MQGERLVSDCGYILVQLYGIRTPHHIKRSLSERALQLKFGHEFGAETWKYKTKLIHKRGKEHVL